MRYACGYVSHRLLKKFEKRKGDKFFQFVHCLGEMAVVGERGDVLAYTHKWLSLVNRGGLFPLNDNTFNFFVEVEKCVRVYLRKHVLASSADGESFKQDVHQRVTSNDDVQFHLSVLSQEVHDAEDAEELLNEIVALWVTVRGFSMTATWMEAYKKAEKKTVQKSTGLRKGLSGSTS